MNETCLAEEWSYPGPDRQLLLQPSLTHAPWIKHAVRRNDPWHVVAFREMACSGQDGIPDSVEVEEIKLIEMLLKPSSSAMGTKLFHF